MVSKLLRVVRQSSPLLLSRKHPCRVVPTRVMSNLIPPNQYEMPWPKRLNLLYVITVYWETIPLFVTTGIAMSLLAGAIFWAVNHKVDVVYSTYSRANISRTMDLRNPTVHKFIIINQRYAPWPEMQAVLDKMRDAEKRALARAQTCAAATT